MFCLVFACLLVVLAKRPLFKGFWDLLCIKTRRDQWYGGLGVSARDSEGWEPAKVGGCGWTRCPWNLGLSQVAGHIVSSRFVDTNCTQLGPFFAIFGLFLLRIVELERKRALCYEVIKAHV